MNQAHHEIRDQKANDHAKSNQKLKDLTSKEIDNLVNVRFFEIMEENFENSIFEILLNSIFLEYKRPAISTERNSTRCD